MLLVENCTNLRGGSPTNTKSFAKGCVAGSIERADTKKVYWKRSADIWEGRLVKMESLPVRSRRPLVFQHTHILTIYRYNMAQARLSSIASHLTPGPAYLQKNDNDVVIGTSENKSQVF